MELFKDETLAIRTPEKPAVKGHVQIEAAKDITRMDKEDFAELMSAGSFSSNVLFEALGAHGTNILITEENGLRVDVLARTEGDGLNFQWEPQKLSPEDMDAVAAKIKDNCDYIGQEKKPTAAPVQEKQQPPETISVPDDKKTEGGKRSKNYLVRQLERIP